MESERRQYIKAKAKDINDRSEQYQMIHATYASQEVVEQLVKDFYDDKLAELKRRIAEKAEKAEKARRGLDTEKEYEQEKELMETIQNRFVIKIRYMNVSNENMARAMKNGKVFTIYLAESLRQRIHKDDETLDYGVILKIREKMAHELGHIVLHTKEILAEDSTQGTLNIKDDVKEEEACLFAKELLELRRERNKRIRKDGGADNLF